MKRRKFEKNKNIYMEFFRHSCISICCVQIKYILTFYNLTIIFFIFFVDNKISFLIYEYNIKQLLTQ